MSIPPLPLLLPLHLALQLLRADLLGFFVASALLDPIQAFSVNKPTKYDDNETQAYLSMANPGGSLSSDERHRGSH